MFEETGIDLDPSALGEVFFKRVARFRFAGTDCRQLEHYYRVSIDRPVHPSRTGWTKSERSTLVALRWWPIASLSKLARVFPADLALMAAVFD